MLLKVAILLMSFSVFAQKTKNKEKLVGVLYYKEVFGHLHQNANKYSSSLTTVSCGYPIKVIDNPSVIMPFDWNYVIVGDQRGFIQKDSLSEKKVKCFQGEYSKFLNALNLDLAQMYYWGRLYDLYSRGVSRVK